MSKVKRKYSKTFMGKTIMQVMTDLRLNGWSYKLDVIYSEDEKKLIYYSIIPLISSFPSLDYKCIISEVKQILVSKHKKNN